MNELEFCEHYCGELTKEQKYMTEYCIKEKRFIGVGRAIGRTKYMPLVLIGKTQNVIDEAGYYQLAAIDERLSYKA